MARYFSGAQGRFTGPDDPLLYADSGDPQTWNLYAYGLNNPLLYIDPDGHFQVNPCGGDPDNCPQITPEGVELGRFLLDSAEKLRRLTEETAQATFDWINAPRDIGCMGSNVAKWSIAGATGGAGIGALGLAGGPTGAITIGGGAVFGGVGGFIAGGIGGMSACMKGSGGGGGGKSQQRSPGNMQKQVERGQAPKSVERVDPARTAFEKPQVHFKDGSALNYDGTWKHGGRALTNAEQNWLVQNGWRLPQ